MTNETDARILLDSLTAKQRMVLDAVADHKSSKEIARELGISPSTVEQRLNGARVKLGTRDRGETVRSYRELLKTCDELPYGFSHMADAPFPAAQGSWEHQSAGFELRDPGIMAMPAPWAKQPPVNGLLGVLDTKLGAIGRPVLILGMAAFLAVTFLLMVSAVNVLQAVL